MSKSDAESDNAATLRKQRDEWLFRAALLHLMTDAAATLDLDGRVTGVNDAMEALFKKHCSALVGLPLADILGNGEAIAAALANGCAWEVASLTLPAGAKVSDVRFRLNPVFDSRAAIAGWIAVAGIADCPRADQQAAGRLDPLTDLPDRDFIWARLVRILDDEDAVADGVAVLCVDLDGFDQVNRAHGRAVGDAILIEAGRRIAGSMRATNFVGRLIEDTFMVLVPGIRSKERITAVAARLIAYLSAPYEVKGARDAVHLSASVGIALAPKNGHDADSLIGCAQAAVDLAKQTGAGTYQFYDEDTTGETRERRSQVNRLRRAIENGDLKLQYQPKVSVASGAIVGAEALVRWQDPESGLIMPADFIPLAEDAGLINPLGHLVLVEACKTTKAWQDAGLPFLRVAVNVSAREIARENFNDGLRRVLADTGITPDSLELEITESAIMEGAEDVIRSLRDIRAMGVHLTADDFGTGYASLSYLRNFPLDGIKIDTTFVSDIAALDDAGGLASAVIAVGHCLGMNVIAEGVETDEQLTYLRTHKGDEVQGYLLSPPLDAEDFSALVQKGPLF